MVEKKKEEEYNLRDFIKEHPELGELGRNNLLTTEYPFILANPDDKDKVLALYKEYVAAVNARKIPAKYTVGKTPQEIASRFAEDLIRLGAEIEVGVPLQEGGYEVIGTTGVTDLKIKTLEELIESNRKKEKELIEKGKQLEKGSEGDKTVYVAQLEELRDLREKIADLELQRRGAEVLYSQQFEGRLNDILTQSSGVSIETLEWPSSIFLEYTANPSKMRDIMRRVATDNWNQIRRLEKGIKNDTFADFLEQADAKKIANVLYSYPILNNMDVIAEALYELDKERATTEGKITELKAQVRKVASELPPLGVGGKEIKFGKYVEQHLESETYQELSEEIEATIPVLKRDYDGVEVLVLGLESLQKAVGVLRDQKGLSSITPDIVRAAFVAKHWELYHPKDEAVNPDCLPELGRYVANHVAKNNIDTSKSRIRINYIPNVFREKEQPVKIGGRNFFIDVSECGASFYGRRSIHVDGVETTEPYPLSRPFPLSDYKQSVRYLVLFDSVAPTKEKESLHMDDLVRRAA